MRGNQLISSRMYSLVALYAAAGLALLAFCAAAYINHVYSFFSRRGIPGPRPLPLVGNLVDFLEETWMSRVEKEIQRFGPVYGVFNGLRPLLVVADPELLRDMLVRECTSFYERPSDRFEHPIERRMMFVLDGDSWSAWRRVISPVFSPAKLKAMLPIMHSSTDHLMTALAARVTREPDVEVRPVFLTHALEVITRTALGVEVDLHNRPDPLSNEIKHFFASTTGSLILSHLLPKWVKEWTRFSSLNSKALETAAAYAQAVLRERRKQPDCKKRIDLTSVLMHCSLEEKDGVTRRIPTEEEIVANILTIYLVGFETISILMTTVCFLLAKHPATQERVYQELREVCDKEDGEKVFEETSVRQLPLLKAVMKEAMRLYPPTATLERKVTKEFETKEGAVLPVGLSIMVPIYVMNRDPEYHLEPERFDPDRFLPPRVDEKKPFTFLPFGAGPRVCPCARFALLESKIALARILLAYEVRPSQPEMEEIDVSQTVDGFLKLGPCSLRLLPRSKTAGG